MAIRKTIADQPAPTEAELGVLRVLWERGASTVREVFDVIAAAKDVGYTTVVEHMQVMHQTGQHTPSEPFRSHVYEPAVERSVTQRHLASTILQQALDGSARGLLHSALAGRKVDAKELDEIRTLLDEHQRRRK